jgi:hypothetical protein
MWHPISTAPFDRDLELAVIDVDHVLPISFPCRRVLGGWIKAGSNRWVKLHPTHWRAWDEKIPTNPQAGHE